MRRQRWRGIATLTSVCAVLLLGVLPVAHCQEWSGFVNTFGASFDYRCPDNQVVTGLASEYRWVD